MQLDFFTVISNLSGLFILIAVGYLAVKLKVVSPESSIEFSSMLLKITLPCTIFISLVQRPYDTTFIHDSAIMFVEGLIIFSALLYLGRYTAKLIRVPEGCRGVWASSVAFGNSGFMGFPMALALFGVDGLALAVILNITFNMTFYTLAALEISRDNPNHNAEKINMKSIIFSNINFSTVLSLIFYFGRIRVPVEIARPISYLSGITTPLSMMLIGMALAKTSKASEFFTDLHAWTSALFSLIIFPIAVSMIFKFFRWGGNPLISSVIILVMAMPAATVTPVLCEMYHGNLSFAAKIMFIQNLLAVVTIPLVCLTI